VAPALWPLPQSLVQPTEPTCDTSEPRGIIRLGFAPVVKDRSLAGFGSGAGRQIVGLRFDRTGQEPQIIFRYLLGLFHPDRRVVKTIMWSICLWLHMCKIRVFCTLPKGFNGVPPPSYIARVRDCLRDLSDRAQPEETKGI